MYWFPKNQKINVQVVTPITSNRNFPHSPLQAGIYVASFPRLARPMNGSAEPEPLPSAIAPPSFARQARAIREPRFAWLASEHVSMHLSISEVLWLTNLMHNLLQSNRLTTIRCVIWPQGRPAKVDQARSASCILSLSAVWAVGQQQSPMGHKDTLFAIFVLIVRWQNA